MKRFLLMLNIMVLSLFIVVMGGGVTLIYCNHTGNMTVAQLTVAGDVMQESEKEENCCGMEPECHCHMALHTAVSEQQCMDYTFVSGQPTNVSSSIIPNMQPLFTLLHDFIGSAILRVPVITMKNLLPAINGRHAPPRAYLRLITVLLI